MNDGFTSPWTYFAYGADTPVSEYGPLESFAAIWRKKCPSPREFPRWKDFDLMDFEGWWGQVSLAELHDDPLDLRWALWGTTMAHWWGVDYTNKFISEIPDVREVWENFEKPYIQRLVDERLVGYVTGTLAPQSRGFRIICGVDLPLEDSGRLTHILSAYILCQLEDVYVPSPRPVFTIGTSDPTA